MNFKHLIVVSKCEKPPPPSPFANRAAIKIVKTFKRPT